MKRLLLTLSLALALVFSVGAATVSDASAHACRACGTHWHHLYYDCWTSSGSFWDYGYWSDSWGNTLFYEFRFLSYGCGQA